MNHMNAQKSQMIAAMIRDHLGARTINRSGNSVIWLGLFIGVWRCGADGEDAHAQFVFDLLHRDVRDVFPLVELMAVTQSV
jgi:hypothetical protein